MFGGGFGVCWLTSMYSVGLFARPWQATSSHTLRGWVNTTHMKPQKCETVKNGGACGKLKRGDGAA